MTALGYLDWSLAQVTAVQLFYVGIPNKEGQGALTVIELNFFFNDFVDLLPSPDMSLLSFNKVTVIYSGQLSATPKWV